MQNFTKEWEICFLLKKSNGSYVMHIAGVIILYYPQIDVMDNIK